ncbi:MAG: haloacid dehalogenase-like hydrolase [Acetobacteraceae bacterium]|jgi:FMN phosphatase YigB (HAD superfamily)
MSELTDTVFLFDVDNTLLDNDRVQADLSVHLAECYGEATRDRFWEIFDRLRSELGYSDYLGALELYRLEAMHHPKLLRMANWLVDYPFHERLYPGAIAVVQAAQIAGRAVILSDGDAVFQPRKVEKSGLWPVFGDNVLIYVHKEMELADVERHFPARHYVMIDDKLRILDAIKRAWGDRVTTVFPRQGRYATDPDILAAFPPADITVERIGDLLEHDLTALDGR